MGKEQKPQVQSIFDWGCLLSSFIWNILIEQLLWIKQISFSCEKAEKTARKLPYSYHSRIEVEEFQENKTASMWRRISKKGQGKSFRRCSGPLFWGKVLRTLSEWKEACNKRHRSVTSLIHPDLPAPPIWHWTNEFVSNCNSTLIFS